MSDVFKDLIVVKRSGQRVNFNGIKIALAIRKAFESVNNYNSKEINYIYEKVLDNIKNNYSERKTINVEDVQNIIENVLTEEKCFDICNSFQEYRLKRAASREVFIIKQQHKFVKAIEKSTFAIKEETEKKPNEVLDRFGTIISKEFAKSYLIENKIVKSLEEGQIYLNDLNSYSLKNISSGSINIDNLIFSDFDMFFNEINKIIINCSKDLYGEILISNFDTNLVKVLINEFKNIFYKKFMEYIQVNGIDSFFDKEYFLNNIYCIKNIINLNELKSILLFNNKVLNYIVEVTYENSINELKDKLVVHFNNLFNTTKYVLDKKSVVFSFDNSDTYESNLIVETYLNSLVDDFNIRTNIRINNNNKINLLLFNKIKEGLEINIVLLKDINQDYFSNGIIVYDNINDDIKTSKGRTINSISTINVARVALSSGSIKEFFSNLDSVIDLNKNALLQRYDIQANQYKENYNLLFDNNYLFDSEKLENNQKIRKVIRNGDLVIGVCGIVEAAMILNNKEDAQLLEDDIKLVNKIVSFIKDKGDKLTISNKLNFIIGEVIDEKINKEFINIDKSIYGINKLLNKDKYESFNSFINKIKIDIDNKLEIYKNIQKKICFVPVIKIQKNSTFNSFLELLNIVNNKGLNYLRIEINK